MINSKHYNGLVYLTIDGSEYTLPINLEGLLENEEILSKMTMGELVEFIHRYKSVPNDIKDYLIKKISIYDNSDAVNGFKFNGNDYWLDKAQRNSLTNLFSSADPDQEFEIILGDNVVKAKAKEIVGFIHNLEIYAYQCYVNTAKHKQAVEKLTKLLDIIDYDYTTGYPEKLNIG